MFVKKNILITQYSELGGMSQKLTMKNGFKILKLGIIKNVIIIRVFVHV